MLGLPAATDRSVWRPLSMPSALIARYCGLRGLGMAATPPTFGQEVIKATWLATCDHRSSSSFFRGASGLGHRSSSRGGTGTDHQCRLPAPRGAVLERIAGARPTCWSSASIGCPYTAGFERRAGVPAEIEGQVIEQAKMKLFAAALRTRRFVRRMCRYLFGDLRGRRGDQRRGRRSPDHPGERTRRL